MIGGVEIPDGPFWERQVPRALAMLAILLFHPLRLAGQIPVSTGQTVRVTSRGRDIQGEIGQVLAANADTIVVQVKGMRTVNYRQVFRTDTIVLPLTAIDQLELRTHSGHRTGRGAAWGLGIGAATGFVVGVATYEPCEPNSFCFKASSSTENGFQGALIFGLVGAGLGAFIGSTVRSDKWEAIPVRPASLRVVPGHDLGIAVTIVF